MKKFLLLAATAAMFTPSCVTSLSAQTTVETDRDIITIDDCQMETLLVALTDEQFHDNPDGFTLSKGTSYITLGLKNNKVNFTVAIDPYTYQIMEYYLTHDDVGYVMYRYHDADAKGRNATYFYTRDVVAKDQEDFFKEVTDYYIWYTDNSIQLIRDYYWRSN